MNKYGHVLTMVQLSGAGVTTSNDRAIIAMDQTGTWKLHGTSGLQLHPAGGSRTISSMITANSPAAVAAKTARRGLERRHSRHPASTSATPPPASSSPPSTTARSATTGTTTACPTPGRRPTGWTRTATRG
ncbi:MAG: hypothetical protein U1F77_14220 [Kiritimatiellia bacterium]